MTATYTWDVFCSLDGFGSFNEHGDWGGYWGKEGPEFLDRRSAVLGDEQRFVLGATTFREFLHFLGPASSTSELDPINTRMKNLPTTVVSNTLEGPLDWPDATLERGDAVDVVARDGRTFTYRIVSVRNVAKADLPADVYSRQGPPRLVLVTCGGVFDAERHHYSDNVVVVAVPLT